MAIACKNYHLVAGFIDTIRYFAQKPANENQRALQSFATISVRTEEKVAGREKPIVSFHRLRAFGALADMLKDCGPKSFIEAMCRARTRPFLDPATGEQRFMHESVVREDVKSPLKIIRKVAPPPPVDADAMMENAIGETNDAPTGKDAVTASTERDDDIPF